MNSEPQEQLNQRRAALTQRRESDGFVVHFALRHPCHGRGPGLDGVRDVRVADDYLAALDRAREVLVRAPYDWPDPLGRTSRKVSVYLMDVASLPRLCPTLTSRWDAGLETYLPVLTLPSHTNHPNLAAKLRHIEAIAAHEVAHVFTHQIQPLNRRVGDRDIDSLDAHIWKQLDEAGAVWTESIVFPDNPEWMGWIGGWADHPHTPLDCPDGEVPYWMSMLVRHLVNSSGDPAFLRRVWEAGAHESPELPFEVIARLWGERTGAPLSLDDFFREVFAAEYCLDSYFLWDASRPMHVPGLAERYVERAVAESFRLGASSPAHLAGESLDHLAARYFRVFVSEDARQSKVRIHVRSGDPRSARLRVQLAVALEPDRRLGRKLSVEPVAGEWEIVCQLASLGDIHHLVIVIANSGFRAGTQGDHGGDDGIEFVVSVEMIR